MMKKIENILLLKGLRENTYISTELKIALKAAMERASLVVNDEKLDTETETAANCGAGCDEMPMTGVDNAGHVDGIL